MMRGDRGGALREWVDGKELSESTLLRRIRQEILQGGRVTYGDAIVATLSRQLQGEYRRQISAKHLCKWMRFAGVFPGEEIVSTLWR
jgi:hypothetical protein